MKKTALLVLSFLLCLNASAGNQRTLHIVTTGDVHGNWFDRPYVEGDRAGSSLMAVSSYVDSLRHAVGRRNVILLDAGDCLQGDNATYYYNYIATAEKHLFPKLCAYMKYDAVIAGNHDIETGHPVYDKVASELKAKHIPFLGGNVLDRDSGKNYFPEYVVLKRGGLKVLVLGYENANIASWLSEPLWEGLAFESLVPFVQESVDRIKSMTNPDVVVVVMHSGTGDGDGTVLESQGLDVFNGISGVDVVVTSHDHQAKLIEGGDKVLVNCGARASNVTHTMITADGKSGRLQSKTIAAEIVPINREKTDLKMRKRFSKQFEAVRAFTVNPVGNITSPLRTRDAYVGMNDYVNLVHTVQLSVPEARLSFAAPLTFDGYVSDGQVIFNDMFTIYPYENSLSVINLKGSEIKSYLEYSYDSWIQTPGDHVLKIQEGRDRSGNSRWSFVGRSYNFDSAAGLCYTVDVTKPYGERVSISGLADGSEFDYEAMYPVAMTSYRANGGGSLIIEGAGLQKSEIASRTVAEYPGIRDLIYAFIKDNVTIDPQLLNKPELIGGWKFIPTDVTEPMLKADMELLF